MFKKVQKLLSRTAIFITMMLLIFIIQTGAVTPVRVKLAVFSDPHYFAPQYVSQGQAFRAYLAQDRKLLAESNAILNKTIDSIKGTDAQIVLITGDLTKDGEKLSHIQVAAYLKKLKEAGKLVLVVPGNHDINNPQAVKYDGDKTVPVETVSAADFKKIYFDYGYREAIAKDPNSLSYVAEPLPGLRIIAIDSCSYDENFTKGRPETSSGLNKQRLKWIRDQLQQAKASKALVIGMMHHGLIQHFSMQSVLFSKYLIADWENLSSEFADLGMKAVFTGHFHAQDIAKQQTVSNNVMYDIETGSLVTYPCPYRIITLMSDKMDVKTETIRDIDYDTKGKPFPQYAADFLTAGLSEMAPKVLASLLMRQGIPANQALTAAKQLAATKLTPSCSIQDLAVAALRAHYIGDEADDASISDVISLLQAAPDSKIKMLGNIAYSLLKDSPPADNNVILALQPWLFYF
jgi:3',5'-cyclic AMP phosphodiesterase CpdA